MPFAKKFRAMMEVPFLGEPLGDFTVVELSVRDVPGASGLHAYALRMVLAGPGGQQAVRRAVNALLGRRPVTFSGYGNPYQLWCSRPEIASLGDQRYEVTALGAGAPISLQAELRRFLDDLLAQGLSESDMASVDRETLIEDYLARYRVEIARRVGRYRSKLQRLEGSDA